MKTLVTNDQLNQLSDKVEQMGSKSDFKQLQEHVDESQVRTENRLKQFVKKLKDSELVITQFDKSLCEKASKFLVNSIKQEMETHQKETS